MAQPESTVTIDGEFKLAAEFTRAAMRASRQAQIHFQRGRDLLKQRAAEYGLEVVTDDDDSST